MEPNQNTTLLGFMNEQLRRKLLETHTALPGVIDSFDASKQEASVRIPIKRVQINSDNTETVYDWPLLSRVPVWMPHAGGFSITMPVAKDDECLVIFLERDISQWVDSAAENPPTTIRTHDISDAVCLVGFNSQVNKVTSYDGTDMQIRSPIAGNHITIGADGSIALTGKDIAISDGTDELLTLLEDLFVALDAAFVNDPVSGQQAFTTATKAAFVVVKDKITNMKP